MSKHKYYRDGIGDNPIPPAKRDMTARAAIINKYKRPSLLPCVLCGYSTRHEWDGAQYVCGCGTISTGHAGTINRTEKAME